MLKIYGSILCKDCLDCMRDLDQNQVTYQFLDFADQLLYLKEFLRIRDENPMFDGVKENGSIGIPCIIEEDGTVTLNWSKYVSQVNT